MIRRCLLETKGNGRRIEDICRNFGENWDQAHIAASGNAGGIAMLWRKDRVTILTTWSSEQVLYEEVRDVSNSFDPWIIAAVYASTSAAIRKVLWQQLSSVLELQTPSCIIGDFNRILGAQEKRGGAAFRFDWKVSDFVNFTL